MEGGINNIAPCAAFLYMMSKETLAQRSLVLSILWSSQSSMPEALPAFPDPQITAAFPSHCLLLPRLLQLHGSVPVSPVRLQMEDVTPLIARWQDKSLSLTALQTPQ